jgi:SAM-dependent methyltransferase
MTARVDFVRALRGVEFTRAEPAVEQHLVALFADESIDWQHLARPAASLLRLGAGDELLHAYLRRTINLSWELEQRFTAMWAEIDRLPRRIAASLALQAFNNGYVWPGSTPVSIDDDEVRRRVFDEPEEERRIAAEIASPRVALSPVRAQYEEHPFPRWLSLDRPDPEDDPVARRVLIAGCGTGADTIELALRHPSWRIEAIDVSARSLAHAIRRARDYGAANIEFRHADLYDAGGDYDRIESIGVLHHLADPADALRALAERLRTGGEMTIAVYRDEGRAALAPLREIGGEAQTIDELREARQRIFRAVDPAQLDSIDFYELGQFRDTLYHAHEMAFTQREVEEMAGDAGCDVAAWEEHYSLHVCKMVKR